MFNEAVIEKNYWHSRKSGRY